MEEKIEKVVDYEGLFGTVDHEKEEIVEGELQEAGELTNITLDTIEKYRKIEKNKMKVNIAFTGLSTRNNAFAMENGVKIILRYPAMSHEIKQRLANGTVDALKLLIKGVDVMVTGVSLNGSVPVVYVSCNRIKDLKKEAGKEALATMINNHDLTPVRAVIIRLDKGSRNVLLDIGGLGIKGTCRLADWTDAPMTEVMMDAIKPGSEVMVKVVGRGKSIVKRDGQMDKISSGAYKCVRRSYEDPFKDLSKTYPVGTVAVAKLVKIQGNMCFMQINGFDRVHIMCFNPWERDKGHENETGITKMIVGHVYSVKVTDCDEVRRRFRGKVLREHPTLTDKKLESFIEYKEQETGGIIKASASAKDDKGGNE